MSHLAEFGNPVFVLDICW